MNGRRRNLQSHKKRDKTTEKVLDVLIYGGPSNPLLHNLDWKTKDRDFKGVLNGLLISYNFYGILSIAKLNQH